MVKYDDQVSQELVFPMAKCPEALVLSKNALHPREM